MQVHFHGTRGTVPSPGREHVRYGGHTACLEVICDGRSILVDAGTGLQAYGTTIPKDAPLSIDLILTHYHWDHIQGMPLFWPVYDKRTDLRIYGLKTEDVAPEQTLSHFMEPPVFPVRMSDMPANIQYIDVEPGESLTIGGVSITTIGNLHPGNCLGLRFEHNGQVFVHLTDMEGLDNCSGFDPAIVALSQDADLLNIDATYTEEEYHGRVDGTSRHGWGHNSFEYAIKFAQKANAKHTLLTHHAPEHTDVMLDAIAVEARRLDDRVSLVVDGLVAQLENNRVDYEYPAGTQPPVS